MTECFVGLHAQFDEQAGGDGASPPDAGTAVHKEVLTGVQSSGKAVEERQRLIEARCVEIVDGEPHGTTTVIDVQPLDHYPTIRG